MTKLTEGQHAGEGLLSEAQFHRSRGRAVIASGSGVIVPGMVLGKITRGEISVAKTDVGGGKGAITLATPAYGAGVQAGAYKVVFVHEETDLGGFHIYRPDGTFLTAGKVGVAVDSEVKFTIADATDFVAGDTALVTVTIAEGSGEYTPSPAAEEEGFEGAEVACAVALYGCDATDAAQEISIIERDAEWRIGALFYEASVDDADKEAAKRVQLAAVGIIAR